MNEKINTLSQGESAALLLALNTEGGGQLQADNNLRNLTMALLMLDAGLRVGEVTQLKQADLLIRETPVTSLNIRPEITKYRRGRIIPLSARIREIIERMSKRWWIVDCDKFASYAFYRCYSTKHLTTRQVERIIRAAAIRAIGRPICPHVLRHTFASRLMRTVNARVVQELLGHEHLSSTQIYCHPNQDDLQRAIDGLQVRVANKKQELSDLQTSADVPDVSKTLSADGQ